jgi:hypothetical protein
MEEQNKLPVFIPLSMFFMDPLLPQGSGMKFIEYKMESGKMTNAIPYPQGVSLV